MANWTIDKRLALGFTAVVVVAIGLGAVAYSRLAAIQRGAEDITGDALTGVHAVLQLAATARTEMALTTEHILTHDSAERAALEQKTRSLSEQTDRALKSYQATLRRGNDRERFQAIQDAMVPMREARDATLALSRENKGSEAHAMFKSRFLPTLETYLAAVDEDVKFNLANAEAFTRSITNAVGSAQLGIIVVLLLAVAVSGGFEWMVNSVANRSEADPSDMRAYPLAVAGAEGVGFPFSSASNRVTTNAKTSAWWPEAVGCSSVNMNPYRSVATASSGRTTTRNRNDRDEAADSRLRAAAPTSRSARTSYSRPTARQISRAIIQ